MPSLRPLQRSRRRGAAPPRVAEVLEARRLLTGNLQFRAVPAEAVAAHETPVELVRYEVPTSESSFGALTIDWGDGTAPTTGTDDRGPIYDDLTRSVVPGEYGSVRGDHLYAQTGHYTVTTTATVHVPGGADQHVTATSTVNVVAANLGVTPGVAMTPTMASGYAAPTKLALFGTNIPHIDTALTVTIDWGDGSPLGAGGVADDDWTTLSLLDSYSGTDLLTDGFLDHQAAVTGAHAYAAPGTYTATVTVSDGQGSAFTTQAPILVLASPLVLTTSQWDIQGETSATPTGFYSLAQMLDYSGTTDFDRSHYTATIDWGDGTAASAGSFSYLGWCAVGRFGPDTPGLEIGGQHAYAAAGDYTGSVTLTDADGHSVTKAITFHIRQGYPSSTPPVYIVDSLQLQGTSESGTAGESLTVAVARGAIPRLAGSPGLLHGVVTASVNWGDGSASEPIDAADAPTAGAFDANHLALYGNHTYAQPGTYQVHLIVYSLFGDYFPITSTIAIAPASGGGSEHSDGGGPLPVQAITPPTPAARPEETQAPVVTPAQGTAPATSRHGKQHPIVKHVAVAHKAHKKVAHPAKARAPQPRGPRG